MPSQVPNVISLLRLACVPVVLWAVGSDRPALAFWLFIAAALSDAVDGAIARRFRLRSELGAWLDPAADKALLVGVYIALAWTGDLPSWLAALVVCRDVVLAVGTASTLFLIAGRSAPEPLAVSKVNTAAQIALAALVLAKEALGVSWPPAVEVGSVLVAATTLLSGGAYVLRWWRNSEQQRGGR